jgi:hypothetical protein
LQFFAQSNHEKYHFLCFIQTSNNQVRMRPINELINTADPGWPLVHEWIDDATNTVAVLPCDGQKAEQALYHTQVTTRSPMGAIVYHTGGILIDNGWIRILGAGSEKLTRSLPDWNKGKAFKEFGDPTPFLLIADDALGGFFLLNGGSLGDDVGKVYYFAPDSLEFEPLDLTYTDFLQFCFNHDLDNFYKGFRWAGWQQQVAALSCDRVFFFMPPLWTKEGKDFDKTVRKTVPAEEQYHLNLDFKKQLGIQ